MKRFLALAALVLGLASCQTEPEGLDVNVGGAVDTTITVSIPETETRYGENSNSAGSVFTNGVLSADDVTMRYIFQVYYNNGDQIVESQADPQVKYSDETSVNFDVRLVPNRNYTFVVWADVVEMDEHGNWADMHYNTRNDAGKIILNNITVKEDKWEAMDESRDAFTVAEPITNYTGKSIINLELKRPFAKLRVITTDMEVLNDLQIAPAYAEVVYTTPYRSGFNAVTSKAFEAEETDKITHRYEIKTYGDNVNDYSKVLFTDYFFANDAQDDEVNFVLSVYEDEQMQNLIKSNNFNTAIPARRNYLTTISGNVLTDGNNVKVDVVDAFENAGNLEGAPYYNEIVEVKSATELQKAIEAINNSTEPTEAIVIVLGENITLGVGASLASTRTNDINYALYLAEGKTATLDLNGKTLTTSLKSPDRHYYAIENHGALTIKDSGNNGAIVSRGIFNYGTLTLESGKIDACDHNGGYAVKNYEGSSFTMKGGIVVTSNENNDAAVAGNYDATTLYVDSGATATIDGGVITNISNFTLAIENNGITTINGGTFTCVHTTVGNHGTMVINGGEFICYGIDGQSSHSLWTTNGSETTINGGTFDGKDNNNGFNVCAENGAVVEINGGNFLKVHSGSLYGAGTINVKGGTFFDDPSARVVKGYVAEKNGDVFVVSKIALAENFADNSWDKIILACQNNIVPESWNVGDTKAMTIGKYTYDIAIIGKNHDVYSDGSGKAPLTLQLFQLYGTDAQMNETQDNTTGWSGSKMRNTTMEEIRSVMPDEVKNAIKAVDKVSLNGSKNALETTSDKLFLLSEKEVNGSEYYSGGYVEGARYAYYADQKWDSNGNLSSQIMKPSPNKDNKWTVSWYLRTPKNDKVDNTRFIAINGSGLMTHITAEIKSGLVFGFCF